MKLIKLTVAAAAVLLTAACGTGRDNNAANTDASVVSAVTPVASYTPPTAMTIKARIYKTNGDYAANVPITVIDGKLASYPDPTDLGPESTPVRLADGYLLDRRGINANSRFTTFTYSGYAAMPSPPAPAELMKAIIPDAKITEIVEMPFAYSADAAEKCNELIKSGLPGCTTMIP